MRAVLDTNVLVSGIFFGGIPRSVLDAWTEKRFELLISPLIYDEYFRTCARLATSYPDLEYEGILTAIAGHASLVPDSFTDEQITVDPDDDKFLLCAHPHSAIVVSGDSDLLDASGWNGVLVLRPRKFLESLRRRS